MVSHSSPDSVDLTTNSSSQSAKEERKEDTPRPAVSPRNSLALRIWIGFSVVLVAVTAFAALRGRPSYGLTTFGDLTQLSLVILASGVMAANAFVNRGPVRVFWVLMSLGIALWI
jgi:hypothetical protein